MTTQTGQELALELGDLVLGNLDDVAEKERLEHRVRSLVERHEPQAAAIEHGNAVSRLPDEGGRAELGFEVDADNVGHQDEPGLAAMDAEGDLRGFGERDALTGSGREHERDASIRHLT